MTPSATEARPEVSLARKPAPGVLPTPMPTSIGQNRRNSTRSFRPPSACHTLVLKFGTTSNPAAWPGAITRVKRPVATVGSPMPIKPLTKPANRNDPNATRRTGNDSPNNAAFLPMETAPVRTTAGRKGQARRRSDALYEPSLDPCKAGEYIGRANGWPPPGPGSCRASGKTRGHKDVRHLLPRAEIGRRSGDAARISHFDGGHGGRPRVAAGRGVLLSLPRHAGEGRAQPRQVRPRVRPCVQ